MCMCVYIYIYIHMHIYIYIHAYIYIYLYTHIHTHIYIHSIVYIYTQYTHSIYTWIKHFFFSDLPPWFHRCFLVRNSGGNLHNCPANRPPWRRVRPFGHFHARKHGEMKELRCSFMAERRVAGEDMGEMRCFFMGEMRLKPWEWEEKVTPWNQNLFFLVQGFTNLILAKRDQQSLKTCVAIGASSKKWEHQTSLVLCTCVLSCKSGQSNCQKRLESWLTSYNKLFGMDTSN